MLNGIYPEFAKLYLTRFKGASFRLIKRFRDRKEGREWLIFPRMKYNDRCDSFNSKIPTNNAVERKMFIY